MENSTLCTKCGHKSHIFQKSSGRFLCKECFVSYFERKFQKTVSKYLPFSSEDIVCVALSGGKDSITLLYNLFLRYKHTNSPQLIAITVDEGISDTFKMNQQKIERFFESMNIDIPLIKTSFKEIFGTTMDSVVQKIHDHQMKLNACTVCASVRRRIINELAYKNGANIIAIGHNLDDIAQSFVMNILRNDILKIETTTPFSSSKHNLDPFLRRIKPLFLFTEQEILEYCNAVSLPYFSKTCQYSLDFPILRKKVQLFLNELDKRSYEYKYNIVKAHLTLNQKLSPSESKKPLSNKCSSCSYPTGPKRSVCTYCEFKQTFRST